MYSDIWSSALYHLHTGAEHGDEYRITQNLVYTMYPLDTGIPKDHCVYGRSRHPVHE